MLGAEFTRITAGFALVLTATLKAGRAPRITTCATVATQVRSSIATRLTGIAADLQPAWAADVGSDALAVTAFSSARTPWLSVCAADGKVDALPPTALVEIGTPLLITSAADAAGDARPSAALLVREAGVGNAIGAAACLGDARPTTAL